ncbi:MAG: RagB/SusD family nutrient uptake outer membrane protein [Gemmatimonadales bacterium]|nr:RagB/SusD family nutrient uptake outer membrane protein [Gemmatimonadales bacterium]
MMNRRMRRAIAGTLALTALGATACTDTTVEPKSAVTEANAFTSPLAYQQFLARVYSGLAISGQQGPAGRGDIQGIDEGFSQYVRLLWSAQQLPSDETVLGWGDVGLPELNTQLWGSANPFLVALYYRVFFQVSMANEFLRQTADARLAERGVAAGLQAEIQTYRAEARFLRALSYYHGMDLFGSIPLVDETFPVGSTPPQQATRQQIYDFVVSELTAIIPNLPASTPQNYGRATRAAGQMLLAKVYLNAQVYTGTPRWSEARQAVEQVIASPHTLDPNPRRPFMADNHTSPEIIFPVIQDGVRTRTWGGMTFIIHASCGGNQMQDSNFGISGCWWGLRMKPQAFSRFSAGDGRAATFFTSGQTVAVASIGDWFAGIPAAKFSNRTSGGAAGSDPTHVDTDFPMFRLADAYLMYAEAVVRGGGGNPALALQYVNALRERAFGNNANNITAPQLTLDFILDERSRELLWEGHRRQDLVRFGLFTGGTYLWSWKGGTQAGVATAAFRNLYPLPASELVANPNLTQNPGY